MDYILAVRCDEPGGSVIRRVSQLRPEPAEIFKLFDRLGVCPSLFSHNRNSVKTIEDLVRDYWKFYTVDDVGLLAFDPFTLGKAHVHITFWDRRLRGREELCRQTALHLMRLTRTQELFTAIPLSARVVRAFARRVGFVPLREVNDRVLYYANAGCFTMQQQGAK